MIHAVFQTVQLRAKIFQVKNVPDTFSFPAAYSGSAFSRYIMAMNSLGLPSFPNQRS
jgi:hypothetical protein